MKRQGRYIVAGLILILLGILAIVTIPRFLSDVQRKKQRVKAEIVEREGQLNLTDLPQPEQQALVKLNRWAVIDENIRTDYVVSCAFFSVALASILLGLITIMFGRIKDLERHLENRKT
jgi:hypothetical protein